MTEVSLPVLITVAHTPMIETAILNGLNSINAITYNRLNLPEAMDFTVQPLSPRSIRNWYSAYGTKLRTEWRTANDTIPKDYVGNLVFVNDTLRTVLVDGGYIDVSYPSSSPQYSYRWFLTDHQGSNRATINASGSIVQANHYYPYGPEMKLAIMFDGGPADNVVEQTGYLYKFSGKEQIPQSSLGWYDFGARWYDPIHARWTTPDPLAEKYYSISPYVYCAGNPVNIVDPEGESWYFNIDTGRFYAHIEEDDDDKIYMLTEDQYKSALNSDDYNTALQSLRDTYTNSFGQLIAEDKLSNNAKKGVIEYLYDYANKTVEGGTTPYFKDGIRSIDIDSSSYYFATDSKDPTHIYIGNDYEYEGYAIINLLSHEIKHQLDVKDGLYNSKQKKEFEKRADTFAKNHW